VRSARGTVAARARRGLQYRGELFIMHVCITRFHRAKSRPILASFATSIAIGVEERHRRGVCANRAKARDRR